MSGKKGLEKHMMLCYTPLPNSKIPKGGRLWSSVANAIESGFAPSAGRSRAAKSSGTSTALAVSVPTPRAATSISPTPTVIRVAKNAESKNFLPRISIRYDCLSGLL